jgi:hypothetical protein
MSAAKWHREEAYSFAAAAKLHGYGPAHSFSVAAREHARAADALEALAVPGVALWLARMANATDIYGQPVTDDQRAALATLVRVAKEDR